MKCHDCGREYHGLPSRCLKCRLQAQVAPRVTIREYNRDRRDLARNPKDKVRVTSRAQEQRLEEARLRAGWRLASDVPEEAPFKPMTPAQLLYEAQNGRLPEGAPSKIPVGGLPTDLTKLAKKET